MNPNIRKWLIPEAPRPGQLKRWLLTRLAVLLITFSVLVLGGGLIFKNRLIFHPNNIQFDSPGYYGLQVDELWLDLPDGQKIRAWLAPAPETSITPLPPSSSPSSTPSAPSPEWGDEAEPDFSAAAVPVGKIAIVLQGNAGNISMMSSRLVVLNSLGLAALTVDYPGYGLNEGRPSEGRAYQSAEAAWQWAAGQGYRPEDILIFGYSLGGGVASYLAERRPPAALVLDSTFTRLRDVPTSTLPAMAPYLYLILGDAFDTRARLARIKCPLLVFHSPKDEIVPFAFGEELFNSYRNNYKDMAIGHGSHTDFYLNRPLYEDRLRALLAVAWPPALQPEPIGGGPDLPE